MPQRVHRHSLVDPGGLGGGVDGRGRADGSRAILSVRPGTPARGSNISAPALCPPLAQQLEQLRRQHGVVVSAAFALLDLEQPAPESIPDLERDHLGDAQPGAVGRAQRRLLLRARRRLQQQRDLLDAQHRRQPARLADHCEPLGKVRPVSVTVKKSAGRDRAVAPRRRHAGLPLVQLEVVQILRRRRIGRPADEGRECPHAPNLVVYASPR